MRHSVIRLALLISAAIQLTPFAHAQQVGAGNLVVWANDGGDKVTQSEQRASANPASVFNSTWDGQAVQLFGARNEVLSFNLVIESPNATVSGVSVEFDALDAEHSAGFRIANTAPANQSLFDWRGRDIELFYVRYLQIKGVSRLQYDSYDERHVPERLRRPFTGEGFGNGTWTDRPDHDEFYPDIAVPIELHPQFTVQQGQNQSIWVDVYIPKSAPADFYSGNVDIAVNGQTLQSVPVRLEVLDFALPDEATAKTMAYLGYPDPNLRYLGVEYPACGTPEEQAAIEIQDRHFQLAHRHRVSLITSEEGCDLWTQDQPRPEWNARLDGSLFTQANGYAGPGVGVGNGIYSIGTYSTWWWKNEGQAGMQLHSNGWETWFGQNSPETERFLYLIDEVNDFPLIEQWSSWIESGSGPGKELLSMATLSLPNAVNFTPSLDVPTSADPVGITAEWEAARAAIAADPSKRYWEYNGSRPGAGTFVIEDDGIALRVTAWAQFKQQIDRWFMWETTYYNNFQGGTGQTNVFDSAFTFGGSSGFDSVFGETGWNYSNGDGLLFYPGTDTVFPAESYGIDGPIASLRLKLWRRGLQDYEYLALAEAIDGNAVQSLVDSTVPKVLREYGVDDLGDPTYVRTDISWSTAPDDWEAARRALADLIVGTPLPDDISSIPGCFANSALLAPIDTQLISGQPFSAEFTTILGGAGFAALYGSLDGTDALGCGSILPGIGELLLVPFPAPTQLSLATSTGAPLSLNFTVPSLPSLLGLNVALQAVHATAASGSIVAELSNALGATVMP